MKIDLIKIVLYVILWPITAIIELKHWFSDLKSKPILKEDDGILDQSRLMKMLKKK